MTQVTIELAPVGRADLPQMLEWRNDHRVWQYTRQNDFIDELHHEAWFERQSKDPTVRMYRVNCKAGGTTTFVGVAGLTSIDWPNRRAEFSLYIAPPFQRRGLGNMALRVLLAHGFVNLGLNVIWGETFETNPAAKMFEKVGLTREGTRRAFYWKDGQWVDAHLYSITAEEWRELGKRDASDNRRDPAPRGGGQAGQTLEVVPESRAAAPGDDGRLSAPPPEPPARGPRKAKTDLAQ